MMVKVIVLQQWCDASDVGMEEARRFRGVMQGLPCQYATLQASAGYLSEADPLGLFLACAVLAV